MTRPVTGGYGSAPYSRATTSTTRPTSSPAWLVTGPPISPASETREARTALEAVARRSSWTRRPRRRAVVDMSRVLVAKVNTP
ncbi:hypothetical protein [Streptomyces sp. NPDC001137]|uniref:hypothetical protein n=1 Tax=Streptomyces sp. NPDC001137 TaxID=3154378 RepID=UPI00331A1FF6